jgi:nucleotide-binding universal stress UspA family protein
MKKILFPTDCSAGAQRAFEFAVQLAQRTGSSIEVMSVYHLPAADAGSVPPGYIEQMIENRRRQVQENIARFLSGFQGAPLGKIHADYGIFTHQEIVDIAEREAHDLIIMGTHGESNTFDRLLGSVTTHTIMQAPCPVLSIPSNAVWKGISHIAYASDFFPAEEQAVRQLADLGKALGAQLHFVHIQTNAANALTEGASGKYGDIFSDFSVVHHTSVMEGLDSYLREHAIDVLSLFIPRRRIWERLFHSSFSRKMVFHTELPLLTFRE